MRQPLCVGKGDNLLYPFVVPSEKIRYAFVYDSLAQKERACSTGPSWENGSDAEK